MRPTDFKLQQVLNLTPLNPAPATCHKRKRKLRCSFRNAALQKLHCNIGFSAVRKSFGPKAALQQKKNCTATSKRLRCRKVALSCRFPAGFKPPRLGTHVSDLLKTVNGFGSFTRPSAASIQLEAQALRQSQQEEPQASSIAREQELAMHEFRRQVEEQPEILKSQWKMQLSDALNKHPTKPRSMSSIPRC